MTPRNFRLASAATALMIFVLAGCSSGGSGSAQISTTELEEPDITIAAVPSADLAGVYIAQDDGFFARAGLHVKIVKISASKAIIADQLAGKVDLCAGAYTPYIAAEAAGKKFAILAEGSIMTPGTRELLIPKGSALTSLSQLAGKTIGMNASNSIGTLLVSAALEEDGVNPSTVHFVTDPKGFPTMAQDLSKNDWDVAFFGEPYATQGEEEYGETALADLDQGAATGMPISGYTVTQSWLAKNPKTAAAFVKAIEAAQLEADTDPDAARAALAKSDALPGLVTDVMAIPTFPTGKVDETRMEREALDMLQFGMLSRKYAAEVDNGALVKSMIPDMPS
jgi:NitT/TauT family transport system substrate-binding protein